MSETNKKGEVDWSKMAISKIENGASRNRGRGTGNGERGTGKLKNRESLK